MVRQIVKEDPVSGAFFVFLSRGRGAVKVLYWDGGGFVIWYKRLERGTFSLPLKGEIDRGELLCLLEGLEPRNFRRKQRFILNKAGPVASAML